jgi:hypothetical protein
MNSSVQMQIRALLMEGGRENLPPSSERLTEIIRAIDPTIAFVRPSALGDAPTWSVAATSLSERTLSLTTDATIGGSDFVFSVYAWVAMGSEVPLKIGISGLNERSMKTVHLSTTPTRWDVNHRFASSPSSVTAEVCTLSSPSPNDLCFSLIPDGRRSAIRLDAS